VYVGGYLDEADLAAVKAAARSATSVDLLPAERQLYRPRDQRTRERSGPVRLAAVPHRLCVVSGLGRVSGTIGALRAGVISDLVIDEPTAAAVLTASAGLRA